MIDNTDYEMPKFDSFDDYSGPLFDLGGGMFVRECDVTVDQLIRRKLELERDIAWVNMRLDIFKALAADESERAAHACLKHAADLRESIRKANHAAISEMGWRQ